MDEGKWMNQLIKLMTNIILYLKNQKDAEQQEHHDGEEHQADGHAEVKQVVSFGRSWRVDLKHELYF